MTKPSPKQIFQVSPSCVLEWVFRILAARLSLPILIVSIDLQTRLSRVSIFRLISNVLSFVSISSSVFAFHPTFRLHLKTAHCVVTVPLSASEGATSSSFAQDQNLSHFQPAPSCCPVVGVGKLRNCRLRRQQIQGLQLGPSLPAGTLLGEAEPVTSRVRKFRCHRSELAGEVLATLMDLFLRDTP